MADRKIHYEAAFEQFLRLRRLPYVAVDEAKRALFADSKLKSFDFVVYSPSGNNLLVDVKGRSLRNRSAAGTRRGFETWATETDVHDLAQWEQVFGQGFRAILAFVYWIDPPALLETAESNPEVIEYRDQWYCLLGVDLKEYRAHMRQRSPKWHTVSLPAEAFRQLARPIPSWL